jgi:hypothetical protein
MLHLAKYQQQQVKFQPWQVLHAHRGTNTAGASSVL